MNDFSVIFDEKRTQLNKTFDEVANELSKNGYVISKQAVHLWAKGDRKPDISKPNHLKALSIVLRISELELVTMLTEYVPMDKLSKEARHVAEIIDRLPSDKRKTLEGIIEGLADKI